ncbi:MAG: TetR/AcrR family transcriptional regulator [bacterium]|nr:TetR/AcrR family transcriptional regulator [bacterium]
MEESKPGVRNPKQARSIEKRNRMISAGIELFAEKGFEDTASQEIAARAGVSVGTFYSYFKDKKALFIEILKGNKEKSVDTVLDKSAPKSSSSQSPEKMIAGIIKENLFKTELPAKLLRQSYAMRYTDPQIEEFHREQEKVTLEKLKTFLKQFEDSVLKKDIDLGAKMLLATLKEVVNSYKIFKRDIPEEIFITELSEMVSLYLFTE